MPKRIFLMILLVLMVWQVNAQENAGIPVIDVSMITQILSESGTFTAEFGGYIFDFIEYIEMFKELKSKFETMMQGMDWENLGKITPEKVLQYLNSSYLRDLFNRDSWWQIFKNFQSLDERYTWINNYDYITENPLYQNDKWKGYVDFVIQEDKDSQKDLENALKLCKDVRDWESEQMTKMEEHNRQIQFYSSNGTGTTLTSRMMTVENMMIIETMRIDLQMDLLFRTMLELETKEKIKAKAIERKKAILENKNLDEIK